MKFGDCADFWFSAGCGSGIATLSTMTMRPVGACTPLVGAKTPHSLVKETGF